MIMPTSATTPTLAQALTDLPGRVRVHELARRAGIDSKSAIAALDRAGVAVGSASSSVDREVAEKVLTTLLGSTGGRRGSGGTRTTAAGSATKGTAKRAAKQVADKSAAAKQVADKSAAAKQVADKPRAAKRAADKKSATSSKADGPKKAASTSAGVPAGDSVTAADDQKRSGDKTPPARRRATRPAAAAKPAADGAAADAGQTAEPTTRKRGRAEGPQATADDATAAAATSRGRGSAPKATAQLADTKEADDSRTVDGSADESTDHDDEPTAGRGRRRRRGGRGRRRGGSDTAHAEDTHGEDEQADDGDGTPSDTADDAADDQGADDHGHDDEAGADDDSGSSSSRRRRRRRRRRGSDHDGDHETSDHTDVRGVKGSTRLEAKRQRRREGRDSRRRPQILSEAEFLARRESVDRVMAVRQRGDLAQVALLEDGVLVEHFVSQQGNASIIGNIYLGTVQNVLPSMEAAFVDIGKGRNAVLYAGEVNWDISGLEGKERRIETALSSGDTVLVQVSKDPVGHKGARLTTQISLPGRFLVFVPGGGATGISRKLPDTERKRLKKILDRIVPADAGVIIRTAAEGVGEDDLAADVARLQSQWEEISAAAEKVGKSTGPQQLYAEPDTLIKVIRDLFNSDINRLLVDGDGAWASVSDYVLRVAPELAERVSRYVGDRDVFAAFRIDEQITKALQRKVRLPSGGSLVIDRTEAMTVVDVNTGKFTGTGGNLEETVTRNNLEAAEEIVRQLRLRDIGGIIVVDFIDMVLESNRDLVLRRLTECLGRDRTRHQVAEVTSLGLVQMTRKRMGLGLVEAFSEPCPTCQGRGIVLHDTPADISGGDGDAEQSRGSKGGRRRGRGHDDDARFEPLIVDRVNTDAKPDPRGPRPPALFRSDDDQLIADDTTQVAAIDPVGEPVDDAADRRPADQAGSEKFADEPPAAEQAAPELPAAEQAAPKRSGRSRRTAKKPATAQSAAGATDTAPAAGSAPSAAPSAAPEAAVAAVPVVLVVDTDEGPDVAKPTTRRRRAAGRPAGAPTTTSTAVDIVLGGE